MKKSKRFQFSLLLFSFLLISTTGIAQRKINGIVQDVATNFPLGGATITLKDGKTHAIAGSKGNFELEIPDGEAVLVVSFVGYNTQNLTVGASETNVVVKLQSSNNQLSDVVVVAYGQTTKRDVNSSVSTLPMANVAPIPAQSINDAVGGRIPGVIVTASNGAPGVKSQISIRGGGTPLFVIDGIIRSQNDFENLDPNDIATYSVLKDAAATSLYGARGGSYRIP